MAEMSGGRSEAIVKKVLAASGLSIQECAERMGLFKQSLWTSIKNGSLYVTDFEKILKVCGLNADLVDKETGESVTSDEYKAKQEEIHKANAKKYHVVILDTGKERIRTTSHELICTNTGDEDSFDEYGRRYELHYCPTRDIYFISIEDQKRSVEMATVYAVDKDFARMFRNRYYIKR